MTFTAESETPRPSCGTTGGRAFQLLQKEKKKKKRPTGNEAGRCQQGSDGPRGGNRQAGAASGETENGHSAGRRGPRFIRWCRGTKAKRLAPPAPEESQQPKRARPSLGTAALARVSPRQEAQRCPRRPLARLSRSEQIAPAAVRRRGVRGRTGARPREGHTGGPRCGPAR